MIKGEVAIITSKKDIASMNIKDKLLSMHPFKETSDYVFGNPLYKSKQLTLITIEHDLVFADFLEEKLDFKTFIFASRHESMAKLPSLLTHAPGNFTNQVKLGGLPKRLCIASPNAMLSALKELKRQQIRQGLSGWEVSFEATHHGPFLEKTAAIFVEIGSSPDEWSNDKAGEAVASAILEAAFSDEKGEVSIAFGGPHYTPKISKYALNKEIPVGHIAPKYVLDELGEDMILQMIERTRGYVKYALLDWKGMRSIHREKLTALLKNLGLELVRL